MNGARMIHVLQRVKGINKVIKNNGRILSIEKSKPKQLKIE